MNIVKKNILFYVERIDKLPDHEIFSKMYDLHNEKIYIEHSWMFAEHCDLFISDDLAIDTSLEARPHKEKKSLYITALTVDIDDFGSYDVFFSYGESEDTGLNSVSMLCYVRAQEGGRSEAVAVIVFDGAKDFTIYLILAALKSIIIKYNKIKSDAISMFSGSKHEVFCRWLLFEIEELYRNGPSSGNKVLKLTKKGSD